MKAEIRGGDYMKASLEKINTNQNSLIVILLIAVIGYFVYGTIDGALAIFILTTLGGFVAILGLIPFVGAILTYFVYIDFMQPFVFSLTGIGATWLTLVLYWFYMILSVILTVATSIYAVIVLMELKR